MKKFNMPHLALQIFESVQLMTLFEGVPAGMISSQGEFSDIFINT